jgi:hypothetical protein
MENDDLFVCFSKKALLPTRGRPLFHDNIKEFAATLDEASFSRFFEARYAWHWYPIITSGFSSGAVHGDLPERLRPEQRLEAIGYAAAICAREDGHRFISALGLLYLLCQAVCRRGNPVAVPELIRHFMSIREATTRNAIDPNIHHWFGVIAHYQFKTGVVPDGYVGAFGRAGLNAVQKGWYGYGMSLELPLVDDCGGQNCPGGEAAARKEVAAIPGGEYRLEYQRSALHEGAKYWIWLCRNVSEKPIYHWQVYIVTAPDGTTTVGRYQAYGTAGLLPPEVLVRRHAAGDLDD